MWIELLFGTILSIRQGSAKHVFENTELDAEI